MSLAKWQFISEHPGIRDGHWTTCGLCILYARYGLCGGCPVAEAGYGDCERTPFYLYQMEKTAENARLELEFLKRIRGDES